MVIQRNKNNNNKIKTKTWVSQLFDVCSKIWNCQHSPISVDILRLPISLPDAWHSGQRTAGFSRVLKLLLPALKLDQLTELYQGAYEDYITATDDSGRERRRDEPFLDLSLEVQSHDSILESIGDRFGAPELLSEAEGNGWRPEKGEDKIDAFKGSLLRVSGLPSLLQLHLKRFHYDWEQEEMSKLNSRCTFPAELDLKEFCSGTTEVEHEGALYDLQSVIVHVGEYASGHYYAYVRPDVREDVWYRFDDDRVTPVSLEDVVKDAYGGKTVGEVKQQEKKGLLQRLFSGGGSYGWGGPDSSAYMLQYVKRIDIKRLYDV
ncbi:Ubiquitin carboxyl-terminal hydrolase [Fragilaria crotonensis]|nr:Ubiquitin carboxyl-terminal hydrolase [Fragilaria crotonensis]